SALTETEVQRLLSIMDRLRKDKVAIMFVTHRLEEASAICDRMTVLRDGRLAGHLERQGGPIKLPAIIEKMVGRAASELYARPAQRAVAGDVVLSVRGLRTVRDPEAPHAIVLDGVDIDLKAGEILGVAGLVGSGRTELARAIFGADRIAAGTITLDGKEIAPASPADAIKLGIGLVPEDRKQEALLLMQAVRDNVSLVVPDKVSRYGFFSRRRERALVARHVAELRVKTPSIEQAVGKLSGGNQQKVVFARWQARGPAMLIL
ncbi:sugar ABC transporter ATP-binding protein, partial [Mesorhizobium sp. M2D.F.Ca.ET.145.01.1.1]